MKNKNFKIQYDKKKKLYLFELKYFEKSAKKASTEKEIKMKTKTITNVRIEKSKKFYNSSSSK